MRTSTYFVRDVCSASGLVIVFAVTVSWKVCSVSRKKSHNCGQLIYFATTLLLVESGVVCTSEVLTFNVFVCITDRPLACFGSTAHLFLTHLTLRLPDDCSLRIIFAGGLFSFSLHDHIIYSTVVINFATSTVDVMSLSLHMQSSLVQPFIKRGNFMRYFLVSCFAAVC